MSSQRKLLLLLLAIAGILAVLAWLALRSPRALESSEPAREADAPPPRPRPSEATEASEGRSSLASAPAPAPAPVEPPAHVPGPPVTIVGRIADDHGAALPGTEVIVYDSRGEACKPEVLRPDWYQCTLHERGRALIVATRADNCRAEVPLELLEPDVERHVDLVLQARPVLRLHVRDLEDKPLPRFARGQPLRAPLRAVASIEDLPPQLSAPLAMQLSSEDPARKLGWAEFEGESAMRALSLRAGMNFTGTPRGKARQKGPGRTSRHLPAAVAREIDWDASEVDDEKFDRGVAGVRADYRRRFETDGGVPEGDPARLFLGALGYLGEDGSPIEGESPERDLFGTLTLDRPLPLRISLLAGQRVLDTREPLPWSEDLLFKIDPERLSESYVHAWLFASDAQSGARLPGARANLHAEPLPGGPEPLPESARNQAAAYAGREAPARMGAPKGWRFPEGDVRTDADGRADFQAAVAGWCRLTLEADGHVPIAKWVFVERAPECYLGYFELAPLATSRLRVLDPKDAPAEAHFELVPLLHAKDREGTLASTRFDSDAAGELELRDVGRQQLLLRSADPRWAIEPLLLDNTRDLVDRSPIHVLPARHVLLHLPAGLPWNSIVHVAQGLTRPVYEEAFGGKTLIELWLADGTYTLRVSEGVTALLTVKFAVEGEPRLVEIAP